MKNILNESDRQEILDRLEKLTPNAHAQWGLMNVRQGLRHMAMGLAIPTGELDPTPPGKKMPRWLMKFFMLNMKPPKGGIDTFKEMNMVARGEQPADFDQEKAALKKAIVQLAAASDLIPENKIAGKFSRDDWGKLNYNHCDHHLKQFGV